MERCNVLYEVLLYQSKFMITKLDIILVLSIVVLLSKFVSITLVVHSKFKHVRGPSHAINWEVVEVICSSRDLYRNFVEHSLIKNQTDVAY